MAEMTSMDLVMEKLDELKLAVTTVQKTVDMVKERTDRMEWDVKSILGPPSLEQRLTSYIDDRDNHKAANATQALLQVQTILEQGQKILRLEMEAMISQALHVAETASNTSERTEAARLANHEENKLQHKENKIQFDGLKRNQYMGMGGLGVFMALLKLLFH